MLVAYKLKVLRSKKIWSSCKIIDLKSKKTSCQISDALNHLEMKKSQFNKLKVQMDKQSKEIEKVERQLKKVTGVSAEDLETLQQEQESMLSQNLSTEWEMQRCLTMELKYREDSGFLRRQSEWCRTFLGHWESKNTLEQSITEIEAELVAHEQETSKIPSNSHSMNRSCTKIETELGKVRKD